MKIAQVIGSAFGGSLNDIARTLAQTWQHQGVQNEIICWRLFPADSMNENIQLRTVNIWGYTRHNFLAYLVNKIGKILFGRYLIRFVYARWMSYQLERLLKKHNYDVVIFHDEFYFRFHHIHVPHLVVTHIVPSHSFLRNVGWQRTLLHERYKNAYQNKYIITVSDGVRDDLIQHFDINPKQVKRIYNPLDIGRIRQQCAESASPHPRPYILGAGLLIERKNFPLLLRAYAEIHCEEDLVIIGDGREKASLQRLAEQLGIHNKVYFAGFQSNPYPWFKHANLFVLSSDYEGLGMVILEALTCGTPVVSTDCPSGPAEILPRFGLGDYLSPVNDMEALARNISRALGTPPHINMDGLDAFRPDMVAKEYLTFIKEATREEAGT